MHIPEREPKKHFSYHQKMAIIQEHLDKGLSLSFLARKYRLSAGSLYHWKRHYVMGEPEKPLAGLTIDDVMDEKKKLEKENEYLKKAIGQLLHARGPGWPDGDQAKPSPLKHSQGWI